MSTWTSERPPRGAWRAPACAALLLSLPGCLAPETGPQEPLTEVALAAGEVRLTAPRGYCIDDGSLRSLAGGGGFALIAPCTQLTGAPGPMVAPALMTVSVMRGGRDTAPPDAESLAAAIAPAPVGARGEADGLAYAQVMAGGEAVLPGGDPRHWRGARTVAGHLASLSLYAPEGSALTGREGRLLLGDLAAGLSSRAAAPAPDAPAPDDAPPETETSAAARPETGTEPRRGLLSRLFPKSN